MERRGAVTWRYVGQAVFSTRPGSLASRGKWRPRRLPRVAPDIDREPGAGLKVGVARRVDSAGRLWTLHDLDTEALRQKLARYDATDAESYGRGEMAGADPYPGPAYVPYLSTDDSDVFGIPVVYDAQFCQGQRKALWGSRFIANFAGGDALAESSEPYHSRAERYLIQNNGGGARCSATRMDDRHILTAAHCIVDDHY